MKRNLAVYGVLLAASGASFMIGRLPQPPMFHEIAQLIGSPMTAALLAFGVLFAIASLLFEIFGPLKFFNQVHGPGAILFEVFILSAVVTVAVRGIVAMNRHDAASIWTVLSIIGLSILAHAVHWSLFRIPQYRRFSG